MEENKAEIQEKIIPRLIEDEMKQSYVDYAMSVIVGRALPDARDGLKPVHRRILYGMYDLGMLHNRPFKKSARIVGEILGKYHPHGDVAVYDSLVRMAQDFSMRYTLIQGQGNFGCFTKETKVALADGRNLSFEDLVKEHKQGKKNYTYTINKEGGIELSEIKNPRLTKKNQKIMKVVLDNNEEINCTLNHKFMLRDGSYKEAENLRPEDSLMPLYLKLSTEEDKFKPALRGYQMVYQPKSDNWTPCHNLADDWNLKNKVYGKNAGRIRHHVDFNKLNNNPDNIERIKWGSHWRFHKEHTSKLHENENYRKKIAEGRRKFWANPLNREANSKRLSERNKENWNNPGYRKKMSKFLSEMNKEYIKNHPGIKEELSKRATKTLKRLWKDATYREMKIGSLKEKWKDNSYRKEQSKRMKEISNKIWSDPKHKEHISKLSKERWKDKGYKEKITNAYKQKWKNDPAFRRYFIKILSENGRNTNYYRFLTVCKKTIESYNELNEESYEKVRISYNSRKGAGIVKFDFALNKFFDNNIEKLHTVLGINIIKLNHKVKDVILLDEIQDVYDLTIEKTHNFALASGVFVHNSIDGDRAAAMRYCIIGDSLIATEKGLLRIGELSKKENIDLKILSKDKRINKASKWFDSGLHPTLKITTNKGYSLTGSKNHPVLTLSKDETGKPIFLWKLLENVEKGDFVVIDRSSDALWPKKDIDLSGYHPKINKKTKVRILPKYLDKDLAFILGSFISEGSFTNEKIEFCNSDEKWINYLLDVWNKVFPDSKMHRFKRKPSSYGKKEYYRLECHCRYTLEFLRNIGLNFLKSPERKIPETILQSPKEVLVSFLKSYFEGDGSISYSSKMIELSCCSKSEQLIKEIQIVLLRFGIDSFKRFDKYRLIWKLYIRGYRNILRFYKELGFVFDYKNKRLEYVLYNYKKDASLFDYVPFISDYIRSRASSGFTTRYNFDRYGNMEQNYEKISSILLQKTGIDYTNMFEYFLTYNYLFDEVVEIKEAGIQRVFSIKVESKCHSFISNGFISHNTEARLTKLAEEMLQDIEKNTVRFVPNFDNSLTEPSVMPSKLPNLIVNGSSGIAVGMATNIPPHNLSETIDGVTAFIKNPDIKVEELMQCIKGPDFPTGGLICGMNGIINAYATGRGRVVVRAKTSMEKIKNREAIIVNEIPYMVNKAQMIEHIADLVRDKKINGISDIRDESDREGMRVVIELKQDSNSEVVLNQLYQHTRMQTTFGVIMLALVNNEPKILNLKQLIQNYVEHRKSVVRKRTAFDLNEAQNKAHILEGLIIALKDIDNVIKLIKESKSAEQARDVLMLRFTLTKVQSVAILDMKLQRLTSLEQEKIKKEHSDLLKKIEELKSILASEQKVYDIIRNELLELKKYSDERKSQIIDLEITDIDMENLVEEESVVITVTHSGYIKRMPLTTYKQQRRGGKGVIATGKKEEDFVERIFIANTHSYMLFFTNKGRVHWLKAYNIPESGRYASGKAIVNLLELKDEKVTACMPVRSFDEGNYLIMATKKGTVKKTNLSAYSNPRRGGIIAITLDEDDDLIDVQMTDGKQQIILATKNGSAVRFRETDVRPTGRSASGVRGVTLRNDEVVGMVVASDEKTLLTVTENGYGKRTKISEYRLTARGGVGVRNIICSERNGKVVSICPVTDEDEVMFISKNGITIRVPVKDLSIIGRSTQGFRLMKLEQGDKVVCAARVAED